MNRHSKIIVFRCVSTGKSSKFGGVLLSSQSAIAFNAVNPMYSQKHVLFGMFARQKE